MVHREVDHLCWEVNRLIGMSDLVWWQTLLAALECWFQCSLEGTVDPDRQIVQVLKLLF